MCTPHRKVFVFRKADWDGIKRKLNALFEKMLENAKQPPVNELWNTFKITLLDGMREFIPQKMTKSDHDIIYAEINVRPNRMCTPHRKVFVFRKADWDGIKRKLNALFEKMLENAKQPPVNELWNTFKITLLDGMREFIPQKMTKSDHDIIYAEINVRPNRMCTPHRKVFVFRKADWDHRVKQSAAYRHLMTPSWAILLITSHAIFNLKDVTSQY